MIVLHVNYSIYSFKIIYIKPCRIKLSHLYLFENRKRQGLKGLYFYAEFYENIIILFYLFLGAISLKYRRKAVFLKIEFLTYVGGFIREQLIYNSKRKVQGKGISIVLPEGTDERILGAAERLAKEELVKPILVGNKEEISAKAASMNLTLAGVDIYDPATYEEMDAMVASFVERRKGKATEEDARKILKDENYFGTMLVYMGKAHGLVSGAAHSTADTVRPALQIIKTKPALQKLLAYSSWYVKKRNMYLLIAQLTLHQIAKI